MDTASILIVEDEAVVALELERNLESMGYHVVAATDTGEKAIELAIVNQPDIVLMDIRLRGQMDGIDAAIEIRRNREIPVIFLTAYAEEEKLERAKLTLPFGYLLKPVQDRDLKVTIEMSLNNSRVEAKRRKAEQQLKLSNLFLDSIIDQSPNPIWISDKSGLLIRINQSCLETMEISEEEVLGKYNIFEDNIIKEQGFLPNIEDVFKRGLPSKFELEYDTGLLSNLQLANRKKIYLEMHIYPIRNTEGEITNVVIQHINISKRKQAEKERFKLAEEFKYTVKGLQNHIFRHRVNEDGSYYVTFSEGRIAEELGITTDLVAGKRLCEVDGITDSEEVKPYFDQAFQGSQVNYIQQFGERWFSTSLAPFELDAKGRVVEVIGVTEDITVNKQGEIALLESESRFRALAELAPVGIYLTDKEGKCQFVNQKWIEMTGLSFEEAMGEGWQNSLHPDDREIKINAWNEFMKSGDLWKREYRYQARDGKQTWVYGLATKIIDSKGKINGFIGVNLDISEQKEAEKKLKQAQRELEEKVEIRTSELKLAKEEAEIANKAKTEFLANISHELRNPMHQILSYSKYGTEKIDRPKLKLQHYFTQIRVSASRLMNLVNDLLDLSKMESGRMEYEFGTTDLVSIIDEVVEELGPSFKEKKLEVEQMNHSAVKSITCDSYKMAQVFRNLLSNSIKFSPYGNKIVIDATTTTLNQSDQEIPALEVSVVDNGIGIPNSELDKIFEKFSQSSKTKTGMGGTGLGLAICREIITAHQGRIWVEHNRPQGAVFKFVIPLQQQAG